MNTTAEKSDAIFTDVVAGLERLRESRNAAAPARSKHDINMVNKAGERLAKALAVVDLLTTHNDGFYPVFADS